MFSSNASFGFQSTTSDADSDSSLINANDFEDDDSSSSSPRPSELIKVTNEVMITSSKEGTERDDPDQDAIKKNQMAVVFERIKDWTDEGLAPLNAAEDKPEEENHVVEGTEELHVSIGIDEAGRGACVGPLVYGACAIETSQLATIKALSGVNDSKQLSHEKRVAAGKKLVHLRNKGSIFWVIRPVDADEIDRKRLCHAAISLNEISFIAAFEAVETLITGIRNVLKPSQQLIVDKITFDAVGPDDYLVKRARQRFLDNKGAILKDASAPVTIIAESKADANYVEVSAASIWAKMNRDRLNATLSPLDWRRPSAKSTRKQIDDVPWGCGYPSDPRVDRWLRSHFDPIFGFPTIVRHSWRNANTLLLNEGFDVKWDEEGG